MFISRSKLKEIDRYIETLQANVKRFEHINNALLKYLNLSLIYTETIGGVLRDYKVKGIMGTGGYTIKPVKPKKRKK